jgi:TRAP-type mannitol/chloroaromatic compound transport system substrate-binding protein
MTRLTRRNLVGGAIGTAALAAPSVARAQTKRWRMVTSWPKRLPGPGMSAERVAERIAALSGGRLQISVSAAGEVVPAFEVLDAVGGGVAEIGHTAAFYWQGKMPAANYFTTVPFGLTPNEHVAWVDAGGGQALWDELYKPFGVKPFMGGNTGVCMGGWFRREIKGLSLQSGVLDAAEFVGPGSDIALGLYRVAPNYYGPGFNKPNGTGECIVSLKAWETLDADLKAIIAHACATEASFALAEMERLNAEALAALTERHSVQLRAFPAPVIAAARKVAADVLAELAARSEMARRVHDSYAAFRERTAPWSRVSIKAVLDAREGV